VVEEILERDTGQDVEAARDGDEAAFARLVQPWRRQLHAHCYRMLGSFHDADDALQETLVRAWRGLAGFEGRGAVRSWLYTTATRVCLDAVEGRRRRALPMDLGPASDHVLVADAPDTDVAWLGPYPTAPDASYEERESVELAFVAACQHLPGNQRAALLLFEVLGFSAAEIAAMMATSVPSVNSALQRARRIVAERVPAAARRPSPRGADDRRLAEIVAGYADALERGDAGALVALLTEDVTWSMPPRPHWYRGRADVMAFAEAVPLGSCGSWRHRVVEANGLPALACYLDAEGTGTHRFWSLTLLGTRDDRIAEITSFLGPEHAEAFGLPAVG
jgi:RNA polymerase sigma-70 factor, ECF subfamily